MAIYTGEIRSRLKFLAHKTQPTGTDTMSNLDVEQSLSIQDPKLYLNYAIYQTLT